MADENAQLVKTKKRHLKMYRIWMILPENCQMDVHRLKTPIVPYSPCTPPTHIKGLCFCHHEQILYVLWQWSWRIPGSWLLLTNLHQQNIRHSLRASCGKLTQSPCQQLW